MKETRFKDTEIGRIPEDWEVFSVGNDCVTKARIGWQGLTTAEYLPNGNFGLITSTDIVDGKVNWETCVFVSEERYKQDVNIIVKNSDILVSKDGTIGKVAIVSNIPYPTTLNSGVFVIRTKNDDISQEGLGLAFKSPYFMDFIKRLTAGSTIVHLYQKDIVKFKFPMPTKQEQHHISSALTSIDNLISSLDKLIEKKKNIKQGAMQQLLTGKKRLKGFSEPWVEKKLGDRLKFQCGAPFQSLFFNEEHLGMRLIKNRDLKSDDQIYYYNGTYTDDYVVHNGDLLIGMDGDFMPNIWTKGDALLNQRVGRILSQNWNLRYLYYTLKEPLLKKQEGTGATTVKHLSHSDIESMRVFMTVDINEQKAIASVLTSMDNEITALEAKKAKYEKIKQGMMQQLLTGKIRLIETLHKEKNYCIPESEATCVLAAEP